MADTTAAQDNAPNIADAPVPGESTNTPQRGSLPLDYPSPADAGPTLTIKPTHEGIEVTVDGASTEPSVFRTNQQMNVLLTGLQHAWEQYTLGMV